MIGCQQCNPPYYEIVENRFAEGQEETVYWSGTDWQFCKPQPDILDTLCEDLQFCPTMNWRDTETKLSVSLDSKDFRKDFTGKDPSTWVCRTDFNDVSDRYNPKDKGFACLAS